MMRASAALEIPSVSSNRAQAAGEVALIFLVFFIHGAWLAPEVNEPHYLGKAKHYWDATWCANDFFLRSADAHEVFYYTFGWLTRMLSLPAVAWCGRVLTWGLMAWSWQRISSALVAGKFYCVLSAALFVALNHRFHMAGEWVIGGVEAKGFAYVFVFLGLAELVRDRWGRALLLFGAGSAFHVIVGGWAVVATIIAWVATPNRPQFQRLILPAIGGLVLALPGLLPAIALTWGTDPLLVAEANRIHVYDRLGHHLLPESMPPKFIVRHLLLVLALVPLIRVGPTSEPFARLRRFVAAAVAIAAAGMALSLLIWWHPDLAASLLRYYWFRMSDVMVPLGVALLSTAILYRWQTNRHPWFAVALSLAMLAGGLHLGQTMLRRARDPYPPADAGVANLDDWRAVGEWAATETPTDAVFLVPRMSQTFRWYSGRAEVACRKDVPQDAAGIVEWWRRMRNIYGQPENESLWYGSLSERGAESLQQLGSEYGADYVVTSPTPPLALQRVGPLTGTVAVYKLPKVPSLKPPAPPQGVPRPPESVVK